jgi:hypothetical protein
MMLDEKTSVDQELFLFFEEQFEEGQKCESSHCRDGRTKCTFEVVGVFHHSCTPKTTKVCDAARRFNFLVMHTFRGNCASCMNPAAECWSYVPV